MKRKVFNVKSLKLAGLPGNWVSVDKKGTMLFSRDFTTLVKGKKVNIIQDEDKPKDWYIEITPDAEGIPVNFVEKLERCSIQSSTISREILGSLDLPEQRYRFVIGAKPEAGQMYALITKSATLSVRRGGGRQPKVKPQNSGVVA
jgi:hypothetical protein